MFSASASPGGLAGDYDFGTTSALCLAALSRPTPEERAEAIKSCATARIEAGQEFVAAEFTLREDTLVEGDETFDLKFYPTFDTFFELGTGGGTITDND